MTTRTMAMARTLLPLAVLASALSACSNNAATASRDQIRAVGSSTVYPFTTAVTEQFARRQTQFKAPIVESTGTGAGMKLFCAGVGARFPDIENASRAIKKSELDDCTKNGVRNIVQVQIGIDGIVMAESLKGEAMRLTPADVYRALAAEPYGRPQTARLWRDVNPALPAIPIVVYGPPPTSGTRDAFAELILQKGCDADPAMNTLKDADAKRHTAVCTKVREDGAYVESGENDNLIVQKLVANPDAVGVFGYSFLQENADRVRGIPMNGIAPSYDTIADYSYPGSRPLYIYVKGQHLNVVPGLRELVAEYANDWGRGGYLARRGLIVAPPEVTERNRRIALAFIPLDPATVK